MMPSIIKNDNDVKVYVQSKKMFTSFVMYPLCITTTDKSNEEIETSVETGVVICLERTESDAIALVVVELNNEYSFYVPKIATIKFITDCQNEEVKVKQLYKDEDTFVSVKARYGFLVFDLLK
ncbi:hypothetical protein FXO38_33466 [Capsicum annuum]|nr:hypothetical protein FXO38_33466 [Capsicum annuum]